VTEQHADLQGKTAIVTGGGRGVGAAISETLARAGADIALTYVRGAEDAQKTVADIEKLGRKARAYQSGIQSLDDNVALVDSVVAEFGGIDILINNAGIASRGKSVADTGAEELLNVMKVHALGPHHLCSLVIPHMRNSARGDIVFISSIATLKLSGYGAPYNMGKMAMEALAQTLAKEERGNNIHVNIIRPGLVETEMGRRLAKATQGVKDMRELDEKMPFHRVCQPQDVADAVLFLVSDRASYLTGQTLSVSGGQEW